MTQFKYRKILYSVMYYSTSFPLTIYHELCHWVVATFFFLFGPGVTSFPTIHINNMYNVEEGPDNRTMTRTCSMYVQYKTFTDRMSEIVIGIISGAPAIGIIILFWISPSWMYLMYIANFSDMWLSPRDVTDFKKIFNSQLKKEPKFNENKDNSHSNLWSSLVPIG